MDDCYVGFKPCGCATAAAVIGPPAIAKETAKFVAGLIREGYRVEIRTDEWVRANLRRCKCSDKQSAGLSKPEIQPGTTESERQQQDRGGSSDRNPEG